MLEKSREKSLMWNDFIKDVWQKNPIKMESIVNDMDIDEFDTFDVLLNGLNSFTSKKGLRPTIRIYLDGKSITPEDCDALGAVPLASDRTFNSFYNRIKKHVNEKEFCILLDRAQLPLKLREKVYGLLKDVYSRLGYIVPDSFAFFFYGEYTKTPFGAHIHDCEKECDSSFVCSLKGEKTIWVWPKSYIEKHPNMDGEKNLEPYMKDAMKIKAEPGEMIYFPSYLLHVGESVVKDSFNLFVAVKSAQDCTSSFLHFVEYNLDCYFSKTNYASKLRVLKLVIENYEKSKSTIKQRDRDNKNILVDFENIAESSREIPNVVSESVKLLSKYFGNEFSQLMGCKYWLSVLSSYGLVSREVGRKESLDKKENHVFKMISSFDVFWSCIDKYVVLASSGYSFEYDIKFSEIIALFVQEVNNRKMIQFDAVVDECLLKANDNFDWSESVDARLILLDVLENLNMVGVIEIN